jgi:hypothetical protein
LKKILFILFLGFCFLANAQFQINTSSSIQESFRLGTKKLGAFYVTKIEQNNNGEKSKKCIIRGKEIDCNLISKCQKGNCDELENYLIKNKILEITNTPQQNKSVKQGNKSGYYISGYTDKNKLYVGEQIYVEYSFYIKKSELARNRTYLIPPDIGRPETNFNGFWVKEKPVKTGRDRDWKEDGEYIKTIIYRGTLTAQKSGKLILDPTVLEFVYKRRNTRKVNSKSISLTVEPLPSPPANFNGAVGNMSVKSEIDNTIINANEAITYKVIITGTGNIELIEPLAIEFPEDFEVYDPKITDKIFDGGRKRSIKTFEYLLIPRYKGEYIIPSASLIVYNPKSKKYETKKTPQHNLIIKANTNTEDENSTINQQIIKTEKKDIHYIFTTTKLKEIRDNILNKNLFILIFFLPIFLIILLWMHNTIIGKTDTNSSDWKNKKANKIALKRLKYAQNCINNNDFDSFFEEIEKSLWGYFADKFKVSIADLSKETVSTHFYSNAVDINTEKQFIALLDECEFARYAPASNKNAQMGDILNKAKHIIIEVETALR